MTKNKYEMEDLLPIVSMLAEKFTSKESSSITYETAEQLMESVLYCINELEDQEGLVSNQAMRETALQAYTNGYELVCEKVRNANKRYMIILDNFDSYGQRAMQETVVDGMNSFFTYYDVQFAPMNHLLTLDYPVLMKQNELCGIDLIYEYLRGIEIEQEFLSAMDREYIIKLLLAYDMEYEDGLDNIARIVYRNLIGRMMVGNKLKAASANEKYFKLEEHIALQSEEALREELVGVLHMLLQDRYKSAGVIEQYLKNDLDDFAAELRNAAKHHCIKAVIPM